MSKAGPANATPSNSGIVAPNVRDLGNLGRDLSGWLSERIAGATDLTIANLQYPKGAGLSHETILFDACWNEGGEAREQGMVVRIKPTTKGVFLDDMFVEQYQLMELMHRSGAVPVAPPLWFEADPTLLGAPFFVMEKVHGRVAVSFPPYSQEGWLFDSTPQQRRLLWEDSVRQLARIQRVPISQAAFLNLPGCFAEPFDQETDRWRRVLDWIDPKGELVGMRQGFDRLMAARPANRAEGIVWGDARLGNMMVGEDYRVVAVMDWEQPSLGGALHDLGWWLATEEMQTVKRGIAPLEGMGARAETIALWESESGKSATDWPWYMTFAHFKMDCLAVRMSNTGALAGKATGKIDFGKRSRVAMAEFPDIFPPA